MLVPQNSQNTIEKYTQVILNGGLEKYLTLFPALDQIVVENDLSLTVPRIVCRDRGEIITYVSYDKKVNLLNVLDCHSVLLRDFGLRRKFTGIEKIQGASVTAKELLEYERKFYREAIAA